MNGTTNRKSHDITNGVGLYREDVNKLAQAIVRGVSHQYSSKDAIRMSQIADQLTRAVANASDGHEVFRLDLREVQI